MARKVSKGRKPAETMRQRQQRLLREQRARKAAKTKPVKASSSTPTSTRVEKVKVKVEGQRQLPPGKPTKGALPPGQRGGALSTNTKPRRRNVNTNPPSNTTRTGSQSPSSVRREQAAVRRAKAEIGRNRMGPLATVAGMATEALLKPVARGVGYQGGRAIRRALGGGEPTLDSKGNRIQKTPKTKPRKRGMSNIPPSEGSRNNPNYGQSGKPRSATKPASASAPSSAPTYTPPRSSSKPKPTAAGNNNGQNLRSGRTPDTTPSKPSKSSKPKQKKYGVKDGNNAKGRSKRLMSALKDLKVRKYKK